MVASLREASPGEDAQAAMRGNHQALIMEVPPMRDEVQDLESVSSRFSLPSGYGSTLIVD